MMPSPSDRKTVLITGASRGIGRASAVLGGARLGRRHQLHAARRPPN
jgi:NAD(P)-dependent dehydrogenase (short-subunit alcohol dehydrogenase family)